MYRHTINKSSLTTVFRLDPHGCALRYASRRYFDTTSTGTTVTSALVQLELCGAVQEQSSRRERSRRTGAVSIELRSQVCPCGDGFPEGLLYSHMLVDRRQSEVPRCLGVSEPERPRSELENLLSNRIWELQGHSAETGLFSIFPQKRKSHGVWDSRPPPEFRGMTYSIGTP